MLKVSGDIIKAHTMCTFLVLENARATIIKEKVSNCTLRQFVNGCNMRRQGRIVSAFSWLCLFMTKVKDVEIRKDHSMIKVKTRVVRSIQSVV